MRLNDPAATDPHIIWWDCTLDGTVPSPFKIRRKYQLDKLDARPPHRAFLTQYTPSGKKE